MKTFTYKNYQIVCEWKKTRIAFKHEATLFKDGQEIDNAKICYQNRTWESYEYESVIEKLLEKTNELTKEEKNKFLSQNKESEHQRINGNFKMIAGIAKLGEILCDNQKSKNDWKARMLKAGLESSGLQMPEDWNKLDENTKTIRLNAVINELQQK